MSLRPIEQPVFLLVAGPNGSGKSSVYEDTDIEAEGRSVWINNPDFLTARIQQVEGLRQREANLQAVIRIEAWLDASFEIHKSVGVETVLSRAKYRRLVTKAKGLGYAVWLIYVLLDGPDRCIERVKLRVRKGGHPVDPADVRKRFTRSLHEQFPWFLEQADRAWIYDNSGAEPRRIGEKRDGVIMLGEGALPIVVEAVARIKTE